MILILRALWPELRAHKKRLVLIIISGVLVSAFKSATPELLRRLMEVWAAKNVTLSYELPVLIAVTWIVAAGLRYYHMYWMLYISEIVAVNLRRKLMNKYLTLNLGFFQSFVRGSGGLISRMLNDIGVIQGGFQKLADVVREPFMVIFSFGYLLYLDWHLTLFVMIGGPIITAVLRKLARSLRKYSKHNQESMEDLTQILKESLDGTRIVQSFNLQNEMRGRFEAQATDFLRSKSKIISREEASGPVSESLSSFFLTLLLIYIGHQIIKDNLDVSAFV